MNALPNVRMPYFHECRNDDAWTWASAVAITAALRRELQPRENDAHAARAAAAVRRHDAGTRIPGALAGAAGLATRGHQPRR
jgi:hypothetical protein